MEIIVLHGDDTIRSYNRLKTLLDSAHAFSFSVERVSDPNKNFLEAISSNDLFKSKRIILVEDPKLIGKKESIFLKKNINLPNLKLIIYHSGTLSASYLKNLPDQKRVEEYKIPRLTWSFLYSFYPGNSKICLKLLHDLSKKEPTEMIFSSLSKHLRDVYWASVEPEGMPYPKWRVDKLKHQAHFFSGKILVEIINELAKIDLKYKTSNVDLESLLDFLIITKLE